MSHLRLEDGGEFLANLAIYIEEALLDLLSKVHNLRVVSNFM